MAFQTHHRTLPLLPILSCTPDLDQLDKISSSSDAIVSDEEFLIVVHKQLKTITGNTRVALFLSCIRSAIQSLKFIVAWHSLDRVPQGKSKKTAHVIAAFNVDYPELFVDKFATPDAYNTQLKAYKSLHTKIIAQRTNLYEAYKMGGAAVFLNMLWHPNQPDRPMNPNARSVSFAALFQRLIADSPTLLTCKAHIPTTTKFLKDILDILDLRKKDPRALRNNEIFGSSVWT
ncbi:hypothetical protein C8J56DRAFT_352855 [Mycena floridula]|nr:hypothetical protein C8J56DRAFT_352855 [Mycena floridula]